MSEMDIAADRSGAEYAPTGQLLIAEADGAEAAALHAALAGAGVQAPIRMIGEAVRGPQTAGLGPGVTVLSVFVGSRIDRAVLDACPDLRLIATRSTGYDHIDLGACAERGVAVANVPTYGENTVAEHTFALILSLSRNVHKAWVRTQRGDFGLGGLQGFDLRGKTLGIVGLGHIGLHVAKIGRGFGMRVLAFDPAPRSILAEILGFDYAGLDELVAEADIISLHAPYSPATHHLVDRALLGRVKRGALLINTARGALVDTQALLWALDEGILAGAGLDVLEGEEVLTEDRRMLALERDESKLRALVANQLLAGRENVVVTPHMAFDSAEAVQRIVDTTAANIAAFLAGDPRNLVGRSAGQPGGAARG
jgi:D-lactate dehydrogenase